MVVPVITTVLPVAAVRSTAVAEAISAPVVSASASMACFTRRGENILPVVSVPASAST